MFVTQKPYVSSDYTVKYKKHEIKTVSGECFEKNSMSVLPVLALKSNIAFKCETQHIPECEMESFLVSLIKPDNYQAVCEENKGGLVTCSTIDSINDLKINSKIKACDLLEKMWLNNKHLKNPLTDILVAIIKDDPDHPYACTLESKATNVLKEFGYSADEVTKLLPECNTEQLEPNVKTGKIQNNEPFKNLEQSKIERRIRAQLIKDKMDLNALNSYIKSENPDTITEDFCNAVKKVNSKCADSDNLKIIFKEFLSNNLNNLKRTDNVKLALDTFVKVGMPASPFYNAETPEIIKAILQHIEKPTKIFLTMSGITGRQEPLFKIMKKKDSYNEIEKFNKLIIPSLKSIQLIGQTDEEAANHINTLLLDTSKVTMTQDRIDLQQQVLKTLTVVGKNNSGTVDAILSFIGNVFKTHRTETSPFSNMRYQALESLYILDEKKYNELISEVLRNVDLIPENKLSIYNIVNARSLLYKIESTELDNIIKNLKVK